MGLLMRRLAVLSLHTSPLAQPGAGDSGGMNVYVRELVSGLAQAGVTSDVYVRRWAEGLPDIVSIENGEAENYWSQFPDCFVDLHTLGYTAEDLEMPCENLGLIGRPSRRNLSTFKSEGVVPCCW